MEDSSFFRKLVQDALANAGFRVTATSSAEHALEELRTSPVSLLVTALVMPGMDGLALLRRVREEWSPKRLRVICRIDRSCAVPIGHKNNGSKIVRC